MSLPLIHIHSGKQRLRREQLLYLRDACCCRLLRSRERLRWTLDRPATVHPPLRKPNKPRPFQPEKVFAASSASGALNATSCNLRHHRRSGGTGFIIAPASGDER